MQEALRAHDHLIRLALGANGGHVFKTVGDAFYAAFATPESATAAALDAQRALTAADFSAVGGLRVRMAINTGTADERDGDYFGPALNRVARLLSLGHGGQVLLSGIAADLVRENPPDRTNLADLGAHVLRDLERAEHVYQLVAPGLLRDFPALRAAVEPPWLVPDAMRTRYFTGREELLARLRRQLVERHRAALSGLGGIGKAVLAVLIGTLAGSNGVAAPAAVAPASSFPPATAKAIDGAIASWFAVSNAPGAIVGIWIPHKGTFVAALGKADRTTGAPMRLDDRVRIGSVTKTFTITVLLQLVDQRRASLDDPVAKYVSYVPNGRHITLRMLANMTAGLFNYTEDANFPHEVERNPLRVWTPRELVDVALRHPPYFRPGTGWHYSNTNTTLLGIVVEKILRKPISAIFQTYSFLPLGLSSTVWPASTALPSPYAHGVTETSNDQVVDATGWSPSQSFTAGQLISTLHDMKVWAKACATGAQISPSLQRQRFQWVTLPPLKTDLKYGLGIIYDHGWIGHNGSIPGYTTEVEYLPSQDATIVLLVNSDIMVDKKSPAALLFHALTSIVTPQNVSG